MAQQDVTQAAWAKSNGFTVTNATDPSGATSACSMNDTSAAAVSQAVATFTTGAGARTISAWMQILGAATRCDIQSNTGAGDLLIASAGGDAAWIRRSVSGTATAAAHNSVIAPRNVTASETGSVLVYGYQIEGGSYPSSVIVSTSGSATTRAADVLSVPSPSTIAPAGRFDATLTIAPNYATAEQAGDYDLLFFDSSNRLFLRASDNKIVMRIGGADVVSSALTWSREQALTIRAAHCASGRTLTVSGATSGNGTTTAGAASAMTLPGTAYLLGNASGAEECSDLRAITFNVPT